jgi:hypothetical protein
MSIETTHRISRNDAIITLTRKGIEVFESDSNERISHELYKERDSIFENYEVVDFDKENEPENNKWFFWKSNF